MSRYPLPKDEYDFQDACLEFLREYWNRPTLIQYGKRGEGQDGVDITDQQNIDNLWVAQCKRHEPNKSLTNKEMRDELKKTETFPHVIKEYTFMTTAKKSKRTDNALITINEERKAKNQFLVKLLYWEDIESELEHRPALASRILKTSHAGAGDALRDVLVPKAIDDELARAKQFMDRHDYTVARALYEDLRSTRYEVMSGLQKFRCLTNLAKTDLQNGLEKTAANYFLEAFKQYPEHEQALANKALAESILGQNDAAWETAQAAFRANPESGYNATVYITEAPPSESTDKLIASLPSSVLSTATAINAIALRLLSEKRYEDAISYARKLKVHTEYTGQALYMEARALQESLQPPDPRTGLLCDTDKKKMLTASSLYGDAAKIAEHENLPLFAMQARLFQLDAARLADDMDSLSLAIEAGMALSQTQRHVVAESRFLLARSQVATQKEDHKSAYDDAKRSVDLKDALDTRVIYIMALWNRNEAGDRQKASDEMFSFLDKLSGHLLEEGIDLVLRGYRSEKRWSDAERAIQIAEINGLDAALASVYRSHIERLQDNKDEGIKKAVEAMSKISENTSTSTRRLIGEALAFLGLYKECVEVLEPIATHVVLNDDTRNLLDAAQKAGLHAYFLKWSEDLRVAGVHDERLLAVETFLLSKYDTLKAIDVINDALNWSKNIGHLRVQLCVIGMRLQRPDLTAFSVKDLPTPDQIDPEFTYSAVECLIYNGQQQLAVEYAYKCLHYAPDVSAAHAALIRAILLVKGDNLHLPQPSEVTADCVVEYSETGTDRIVTIVIDDDVPAAFPEIVKSDNIIAKSLKGHKIGEEVVLVQGLAQDRTAVIKGIYNKYVFRMNACLMSWQLKFPEEPFIQQMRMETDPVSGQVDIGPLSKMLTISEEHIKNIDQLYKSGAVSIAFMAQVLNRSVFDTMEHLAYDDDLFINSAFITNELFLAALDQLNQATGLVLDVTSLWTLIETDMVDVLEKMPIPVFIAQETIDAVRERVEKYGGDEAKSSIRKQGDGISFIEMTPEESRARYDRWISVARTLQMHCKVGSSLSLASLEATRRKEVERLAGGSGIHSIAAAKDAGCILWGEDRVQGVLGVELFGIKRVWSQVVLAWLKERGIVSMERYRQASIKMQGLRISGIGVQADSLIEAGRMSDWQPESLLLQRNLNVLSESTTIPQNVASMSLRFIQAIKREVPLTVNQDVLINLTLEEINKRKDGALLIQALVNVLPRQMPLDPIGCTQIQEVIRAWLKAKLIV